MRLHNLVIAGVLLPVALACVPSSAFARERNKDAGPVSSVSNAGRVNLGLAQSYLKENDLQTALERAQRALRTDPGSSEVHAILGLIYNRIGDQGKAEQEMRRAIDLTPNNGSILNAYGTYACSRGQFDVADAQFSKALLDPFYMQPAQALYNAGKCAKDAGQMTKAEAYLRRALDMSPEQGEVLFKLAEVELAQGKTMEARAFIQRRDALGKPSREVLELAARIEDAAGDRSAAARYRQRIQDLSSDTALPTGEGASQP
ncbi:type IV pilus biogenesis/stability protein PilW [Arenimonas oryziterrae]|uniref:Uncharacterized protein n=1 Tax=Arenimonas oryziterrae DSM 21050 = YC6267 TaxID=1121015 RepID=A0A091AYG8_9GAMM|nr:type IV pilus biogenesis/stability protein PilW [Arenimonas oryziterrae]KFN44436.1 hypothetical protein N789_00075 [Arenimonas oryziterrae DSM 21050 = YC6267]